MSKIILNGIEYSNGITYQELQPVIYSDEEREIGVWRDGKPLYQKTIDVGMLPNRATKTVNYDVANVDAIVKIFGIGIATTGACCPIPFSDDYSSAGNILLDANTSSGTIRLISQSDKSPFHGYITIQYTKTTDVAGSGSWTPSGVPSVHYSTNEQVIGTWIDGKPLYQKTLVLNNLSVTNNQWAKTNESATNIETIVDGFLNDNQSPSQTFQCDIGFDGGKVAVLTWFVGNSARTMSYLTFRYTKTTD